MYCDMTLWLCIERDGLMRLEAAANDPKYKLTLWAEFLESYQIPCFHIYSSQGDDEDCAEVIGSTGGSHEQRRSDAHGDRDLSQYHGTRRQLCPVHRAL